MIPKKLLIPKTISELRDHLSSMALSAPTFRDASGSFPFLDLNQVFQELDEGLVLNRTRLGVDHFSALSRMSREMRALFEADPEDKTGDTHKGVLIIRDMQDLLEMAQRKRQK